VPAKAGIQGYKNGTFAAIPGRKLSRVRRQWESACSTYFLPIPNGRLEASMRAAGRYPAEDTATVKTSES